MKTKKSMLALAFLFLLWGNGAMAQTEVPEKSGITVGDLGIENPGILPGNPFYFFKEWRRGFRLLITRNPVRRVELELNTANQRAAEVRKLEEIAPQNVEALRGAIERYRENMESLGVHLLELKGISQNPNVDRLLEQLTDRSLKHEELFAELQKKFIDEDEFADALRRARGAVFEAVSRIPEQVEDPDKFRARIERVLEGQRELKGERTIEVLRELETRLTETARERISVLRETFEERIEGAVIAVPATSTLPGGEEADAKKDLPATAPVEEPKKNLIPIKKEEAPKPKVVVPPIITVLVPPPAPTVPVKELVIEVDDAGLHPAWVTVKKGEKVRLTFKVLMSSTDYEGFIFKTAAGVGWDTTPRVFRNYEETVEFIADKSFEFTSQVYSGAMRGRGSVTVEE